MQTPQDVQHSSYVNMTPNECVTRYLNRTLFTKALCAVAAVALMFPPMWAWSNDKVGFEGFALGLALACAVALVEVILLSRWLLDFECIMMNDCDPVKMYQAESLLDGHLKLKNERATHLLIGAQAAMLMGDVGRAEHLMRSSVSLKAPNASSRLLITSIETGCAVIKQDWLTVQALRDDLNNRSQTLRGALCNSAELQALYACVPLAIAQGNVLLAETLLGQSFTRAIFIEQFASLTYHQAELEELKGNLAEARACYERAASLGGTCHFARSAANWLATH